MNAESRLEWFVAQLKPNALAIAERNLSRQGFATFMPQIERDERSPSGFQRRRRPLFPGYLFVRFDPLAGGWRAISSTRGVARLVAFGDATPQPVSHALMRQIRQHTDAEGIFRTHQTIRPGDQVTVLSGPFADFVARVHEVDDAGRAWLLLDLLGQETRVQIKQSHLARA